jgi:hypothetical protein
MLHRPYCLDSGSRMGDRVRRAAWYELRGLDACICRTSTSPPCIRRRRVRHTRRTCALAGTRGRHRGSARPRRSEECARREPLVGALARIDRGRSTGPPICSTAGSTGGRRGTRRVRSAARDSTHIHISDRRPKQQDSLRASGDGAGPSALTLLHSIARRSLEAGPRPHRTTATAASNAHSFRMWGLGGRGA